MEVGEALSSIVGSHIELQSVGMRVCAEGLFIDCDKPYHLGQACVLCFHVVYSE